MNPLYGASNCLRVLVCRAHTCAGRPKPFSMRRWTAMTAAKTAPWQSSDTPAARARCCEVAVRGRLLRKKCFAGFQMDELRALQSSAHASRFVRVTHSDLSLCPARSDGTTSFRMHGACAAGRARHPADATPTRECQPCKQRLVDFMSATSASRPR